MAPAASIWDIFAPPAWAQQIIQTLATLTTKVDKMAAVQVDQTDLDNLTAALEAVKTSLENEIATLQQQAQNLPPGSLDGLNTALSDLQSLEVPAPTPPTT